MICDDEPDLRLLFGQMLGSKYNVILVESGENCIEKYKRRKEQGQQNTPHITRL
jgi:CheY-like chemotaxis protein